MSREKYTSPSKPEPNPVPTSGDRVELASYSVREALLDIVWSNVDIPRAMKGVVAKGVEGSSFSKKFDAERVLIGTELRPHWPEGIKPGERIPNAVLDQYGPTFEPTPEAESEFLRMHTLRQYGHLIYSDDDMPKLAAMAEDAGATVDTFGLLETIRVERRMGISLGRSFEWDNYYPSDEGDKLPAVDRPLFHWLRDGWRLPLRGDAEREAALADFYDRLIGAIDSREVADLAIEWRDKLFPQAFPEDQPQPGEGEEQDQKQDGQPQDASSKPGKGQPGEGGEPGAGGEGGGPGEGGEGGEPGEGPGGEGGEPGEGPGSPGGDGQPHDGKPSEGKDGKPGEGKDAKPGERGDRMPGDPPAPGAPDPYNTKAERQPGESSLMKHIGSGLKRDAKADEAAAKSAAKDSAGKPGSGKEGAGKPGAGKEGAGKEGAGKEGAGKGTSGPATTEITAPSNAEAQEQRGHGYSKGVSDSDGSPPAPGEWRTHPKNVELLEGSTDYFAKGLFGARGSTAINKEEATKAKRILERMLTGKSRNVLSDSPSKRISMRHMARGEIKFNKREDFSRGSMNIDMVVDCSGSMSGPPMESARSLISALSDLSGKGLITGRVIFSSGEGWMACPLPMKEDKITKICAFSGSEGIQRALTDNVRRLRTADAVFVYTDAQITDSSFDKSELRARKVEPMGLYVGSTSAESEMRGYFDRYLIRENLEELCLGMVQRFISQRKLVLATQVKKAKMRR